MAINWSTSPSIRKPIENSDKWQKAVGIKPKPSTISTIHAIGVAICLSFTIGFTLNCVLIAGDSFDDMFLGEGLPNITRTVVKYFPEDPITILIVSVTVGIVTIISCLRSTIPPLFMWTVSATLLATATCLLAVVAPHTYLWRNMSRKFGDSDNRIEGTFRWVDECIWITVAIGIILWLARKEIFLKLNLKSE